MPSFWSRAKETFALFAHIYTSNPLPKLNRILSTLAIFGFIASMLYAMLDKTKTVVTLLLENAPADKCTSMKSSISCKTSDGTSYNVDAGTCVGYTTNVYDWNAA